MNYGSSITRFRLEPVSGKALPVRAGQTLHITLAEGPQCVDFNCFNLHDYREAMSVGHMRRTGFRSHRGSIIWSKPPRYSPMMVFLEKPDTCVTDLLAARCHATQFEKERGYPGLHTNCQDTFAESIGEYGLCPDDVHDSLNMWMNTGWDDAGNFIPNVRRNTGRKGDTVVLLALMDVLAVPIVCGSGDVSNTSNYWFRPIDIEIRDSSPDSEATRARLLARHTGFINQRKPGQYRVAPRDSNRECRCDPHYKPRFVNFPIQTRTLALDLDPQDHSHLDKLMRMGQGQDAEDAFRTAVMTWYTRHKTRQIVPESLDL
jgi:uncharacterized protein YcgI (DUF1989 family)